MALRDRLMKTLAQQLGHPSGPLGRVTGRRLNRGNHAVVAASVEALSPSPGCTALEIGFGGGVGLGLLLERVGATGVVEGVEVSRTMLAQARRRFRREVAAGQLRLHEAGMQRLPLLDASVDVLLSTNTIYFVGDLAPAVAEMVRVLRPGGRLGLGVADPDMMAKMPFTQHGFTLRPISEIVGHLERSGLTSVTDHRVGSDARAFHILTATAPRATDA
jgi:arsenite methyltransferase